MFLKLFQGQGQDKYLMQFFANRIHTQICLNTLFEKRHKVENEWRKKQNEWNDDEDEQRRVFHEEEMMKNNEKHKKKEQPKCEITNKKNIILTAAAKECV